MDSGTVASSLVVGLTGSWPTPAERAWLHHHRPAGVILFARNVTGPEQLRALCRQLREDLPPGAEIMADHEGGPISTLAAAIGRPPAPFALGVLDDPELTRRVHRDTAQMMRASGLQRVLAPCADVLVFAQNPVIGSRAFGPDPALVARQVAAAVTGLREGGLRACLKHWPGHGATAGDSHDGPVEGDAGILQEPFRAGVLAGADAVMVGHVLVDQPGASARRPATLVPGEIARARALVSGRPTIPFADDLTMGALRPAMASAGISLDSRADRGLIAPELLPAAWFEATAAAGCQRLLCRGIPWRAFPLAGARRTAMPAMGSAVGAGSSTSPSPRPGPAGGEPGPRQNGQPQEASVPVYGQEPDSYRQARSLLAGPVRPWGFASSANGLLWLDATREDRWGEADGLLTVLAGHFSRITRIAIQDEVPALQPFEILLITSHRPLPADEMRRHLFPLLAPTGSCLAMGHPSLAMGLAEVLPGPWRVRALYDVDPADMRPVLAGSGG